MKAAREGAGPAVRQARHLRLPTSSEDDLLGGHGREPVLPARRTPGAKEEDAQCHPHLRQDRGGHRRFHARGEKWRSWQEMGIESTGLDNLIKASYELLGLISFLTDGKKECRAWTIRKGTKAPQAAGKIHSDFERGFIRAQVIAYKDLEDCRLQLWPPSRPRACSAPRARSTS